ncbi:MAG: RNA polymerase sigma factor (sigma-70 family), partial [Bacteroidia bacterium]
TFSIHTAVTTDDSGTMQLDIMDSNRNPQEEAIRTQKLEIVREFVTLLPPKYQRLVKLRYFEEYSYDEIAKEIEAPLGTVKAQLHRARELLYDLLKNSKNRI